MVYKFVAQTSIVELLRVHSDNGSLAFCYALYDGCGGTELVCNNFMGTNYANEALGGLTPGRTYYLRLWSQFNFTSLKSFVQRAGHKPGHSRVMNPLRQPS